MYRTLVLRTLGLLLTFTASMSVADDWTTITSGWRPEHILAVNGDLWAASEGGLLHVPAATGTLEVLNVDDNLFSSFFSDIAVDPATGYLWIAHSNGGLDIYDIAGKLVVQTLRDFYNDPSVTTIDDIFIDENNIFVGTDAGLSRLLRYGDEELWVVQETYRGFGSWSRPIEITDIAVYDNKVFVASGLGIAYAGLDANLLDVNNWTTIRNQDILPGIETNGVQFLKVVDGELYLAFYQKTMYRWDDGEFIQFTSISGVFDLVSDGHGVLYAGRGDGLYRKQPQDPGFIRVNDEYTAKFWSLAMLDGDVWAAIDTNLEWFGGIVQWDGSQFEFYYPNTPGGDQILTMAASPSGEIWLAARSSRITGVYHLSGGVWYPYAEANTPQAPWSYAIATTALGFDAYGGTWIGSWGNSASYIRPRPEGGDSLFYFDSLNSDLESVTNASGNYIVVNGFEQDPGGGLWMSDMLAWDDSTLVYVPERWFLLGPDNWDMSDWVRYGPLQGFNFEAASVMKMDQRGRLWIASINPESDKALVMMDPHGTPLDPSDDDVFEFNEGDTGFGYVNDMVLGPDQLLWLGTPLGLYYIDVNLNPEQVVFTKVTGALGESVTALAIDPLNQIWVGTDFGLSVLGRDKYTWIKQYTTPDGPAPSGLVDNQITALAIVPATGQVYIGTSMGLSVLNTPYRKFGTEIGEIEVAPQPFLIGDSGAHLHFSSSSLVADADIHLYTLSGRLVRTLDFATASAEGWDGRDNDGDWVGSGIYYILVTGPNGSSKTGKVAVVRE